MLENQAILNSPVAGTNKTQGEMLAAINPQDPRLQDPGLDEYETYLMWVFRQLDRDRNYGMGGAMPFTLQNVINYQQVFEDRLYPEEVQVLQQLDVAYLNKRAEISRAQER